MRRPSQQSSPPKKKGLIPGYLLLFGVGTLLLLAWGVFARYAGLGAIEQNRLLQALGYFVLLPLVGAFLLVAAIKLVRRLTGTQPASIMDRVESRVGKEDEDA